MAREKLSICLTCETRLRVKRILSVKNVVSECLHRILEPQIETTI